MRCVIIPRSGVESLVGVPGNGLLKFLIEAVKVQGPEPVPGTRNRDDGYLLVLCED